MCYDPQHPELIWAIYKQLQRTLITYTKLINLRYSIDVVGVFFSIVIKNEIT